MHRPFIALLPILLLALGCDQVSAPSKTNETSSSEKLSSGTRAAAVEDRVETAVPSGQEPEKKSAPETDRGTETKPESDAASEPAGSAVAAPTESEAAVPPEGPAIDGDPAAELETARSLRKQGRYDQAIEILHKAYRMRPGREMQAEILFNLANAHFRFGQEADWERLDHGLEADPNEQFRAARSVFQHVATHYPELLDKSTDARYMMGSCHLVLGEQKLALAEYERAYERKGASIEDQARALLRVGVCYSGIGEPAKARAIWNRYVQSYAKVPKLTKAVAKVKKYLYQLQIVGRPAAPIQADAWIEGVLPGGLADVRGDVVVLVFFSTGCAHCKKEMPRVRRDVARWGQKGVAYIGIADPKDPEAQSPIDVYVKTYGLDFLDVAVDPGGRTQRPYRVTGFPAAAIIDKRGIVRWRGHYAFINDGLIETLLGE